MPDRRGACCLLTVCLSVQTPLTKHRLYRIFHPAPPPCWPELRDLPSYLESIYLQAAPAAITPPHHHPSNVLFCLNFAVVSLALVILVAAGPPLLSLSLSLSLSTRDAQRPTMARPTPSPCHPRLLALIVACLLLLALLPSSAVAQEAEQAHQADEQPHEPAAPAAATHDTAATDSSSAPAVSSDSDTNERARRLPSARQSSRRTRIDNQGLSARLAAATESVEKKLFECRESCAANDDMHLFCEWHCANAGECGTRALARWKNVRDLSMSAATQPPLRSRSVPLISRSVPPSQRHIHLAQHSNHCELDSSAN